MSGKSWFCPLAFEQVCIHTDGGQKICCHSNIPHTIKNDSGEDCHFSNEKDMDDPLNNKSLRMIRLEMIEGRVPEICSGCFTMEQSGRASFRQEKIQYSTKSPEELIELVDDHGFIKNKIPEILDLSLGNSCNLKCRMCHPYYSAGLKKTWEDLELGFDRDRFENVSDFSKSEIVIPDSYKKCHKFVFQGGEPLINRNHPAILEKICSFGHCEDVTLEYNTNLTILDNLLFEKWRQFKKVHLYISLDGVENVQEKIRFPLKWNVFINNIEKLKCANHVNISFSFVTVLQSENLGNLPEIMKFSLEHSGRLPDIIYLTDPDFFRVAALSDKELQTAKEKWKNYFRSCDFQNELAEIERFIMECSSDPALVMKRTIINSKYKKLEERLS